MDLSRFSPGTTLYLCGFPVGRVHAMRIPRSGRAVTVEVLEEVRVEWTLLRTEPTTACPGGWKVASVTPLEETARTREITWEF